MNNYGVVVLHYQTVKDTEKCVDSFLKTDNDNNVLEIVIVDNCSPNNTYLELVDRYAHTSNVHVLHSNDNLGFAKGNNLGVKKLYDIHKSYEYIICCNNDTYITDNRFLSKVSSIIKETRCDVLGPDIIRVYDNKHQNPLKATKWTVKKIQKRILEFKLKIIIFSLFPFLCRNNSKYCSTIPEIDCEKFQLHGSFIIFANSYLKKHQDVFYSKTFLYLEEDILFLRCELENFKMIYDDRIVIYHNHSSSTKTITPDPVARRIVFLRNQINSLKIVKEYLLNNES